MRMTVNDMYTVKGGRNTLMMCMGKSFAFRTKPQAIQRLRRKAAAFKSHVSLQK